jgi:hypothetical protein
MKFESPFHDWPRVTAINDKNGTGVHITGTFLGVAPSYYILAWYIVLCTMGVMAVLPLSPDFARKRLGLHRDHGIALPGLLPYLAAIDGGFLRQPCRYAHLS